MNKAALTISALGLVLLTGACSDVRRERNAARYSDRPADITCWSLGAEVFSGRSTGRVSQDDGGFIGFVDAANGRYTVIHANCRVVYQAKAN